MIFDHFWKLGGEGGVRGLFKAKENPQRASTRIKFYMDLCTRGKGVQMRRNSSNMSERLRPRTNRNMGKHYRNLWSWLGNRKKEVISPVTQSVYILLDKREN